MVFVNIFSKKREILFDYYNQKGFLHSASLLMIVNNGNETLNIVVYNIVGQPVLSETVATGSNVIRHDLAEGVYIVRIANGKEMKGVKIDVRP